MKPPETFLTHLLEAIAKIEKFVLGYSFDQFCSDEKTHESVIRQIEIIGEAMIKIESLFKPNHPEIPWEDIRGMRNHLIHEYWDINLADVWETVQTDVPKLKQQLEQIQKNLALDFLKQSEKLPRRTATQIENAIKKGRA